MFKNSVFENYTGGDATGEIIIMLLGAFVLGYVLRWLQNRFWGCEHCTESEIQAELRKLQSDVVPQVETAAVASVVAMMPAGVKKDDLKIVEGIGPKISELLIADGITTWAELSSAETARLKNVLGKGGDRFRMHDPSTWAEQAGLADTGKWDELDEYQEFLNGGKLL